MALFGGGAGGEVRKVAFQFVGDASKLKRASGEADRSLGSVSKSGSKTSGVLAGLKPAAAAAGAAAAAMAVHWAVGGIKMAESAQLIEKSFTKTFGGAADDFLARNDEIREAMGLTEAEFQQYAVRIGATGRALGQSEEEAAAYSEQILRTAGDLAAFSGDLSRTPEAIESITAALAGSTETMDKWGVDLKQREIDLRAMQMTGKDSADQLTQLEKRTATLAIIQERATLSQGALNDAMADGATDANELSAQTRDLQTKVGEGLLPVKKVLLEVLLALLPVLEALTPLLNLVGLAAQGLGIVLKPVIWAIERFGEGLEIIFGWLGKLAAPIDKIASKIKGLGSAIGSIPQRIRNPFEGWRIPSFQKGGTVPGPPGAPMLATVHGGERISNTGGGGGGPTIVNQITVAVPVGGDPMTTAREIANLLEELSRNEGPIAIETKSVA
jgi:hypothetical protein